MSGGRTKDGGDIVGASVFYHDVPSEENKDSKSKTKKSKFHNVSDAEEAEDPVAKLDQELTEGKRLVEEAERYFYKIKINYMKYRFFNYEIRAFVIIRCIIKISEKKSKKNLRMCGSVLQLMQYQKSP